MPNHITNRVEIKGTPELIKQVKAYLGEKIDFEKILPTPTELDSDHTISPTPDPDSPKNVALREKYGVDNWYDWHLEKWGTKWNAYYPQPTITEKDYLLYEFSTAWSMPEGIARLLAKKFPKAQIVWSYADEDLGNNCGIAKFSNGKLDEFINKEGDIEWCERLRGWEDDEDDEDDECHDNYSSEVNINLKKRKTSYGVVYELEYDNEDWHFTGTAEEVLEELSEHMENMLTD